MFEQSFVQGENATRKTSSVLISLVIQVSLVTVAVLIPMIYYEALPKTQLTSFLVAPPPPPPPPPPPAAVPQVKVQPKVVRQFDAGRLMAPKTIPKEVAMIKEEEMPSAAVAGVVGGVPGGVPGGTPGGVIGGIIGSVPSAAPPPPPPPKEDKPKPVVPKQIRVGGNVQAAKLVNQPKPQYPPLARQARIQGVVRFNAVIGKDGSIANLTLVSGHPLLVPSATEAVRQWRYQPTLLNGEPVEVVTQIDVNFTLSQ